MAFWIRKLRFESLRAVSSDYPWIVEAALKNRFKQFVIDGEAVVLGLDGVADFNALHSRKHDDEVQLYAFDILALGGEDLRKLPLSTRLLARRPDGIFVAPFEQGEIGPDLFRAACRMGLEGLVSKRRDRPYQAGASPHWVKVKNRKHPGHEPSDGYAGQDDPGRHPKPLRSGLAGFLRRPMRDTSNDLLVCQIRSSKACAMKHQHHFGTSAAREAVQTRALIADLDRIVQILNDAIAAEEQLVGVTDRFQAGYPMHARELAARRDNLRDTIAALERTLGN